MESTQDSLGQHVMQKAVGPLSEKIDIVYGSLSAIGGRYGAL